MKKLIALACVFLSACSMFKSDQQVQREEVKKEVAKQIDQMPDWYTKPPKDKDAIYEKAVAKSKDMQMAMNKATMLAKAQLAVTIKGEVNSLMRLYVDENGDVNNAQASNNASVTTSQEALLAKIVGAHEEKSQIFQEGDKYVAYVLIKYPMGDMNKLLMDQLRQEDAANSRVRADEAYDTIERKIEDRRKSLTN